MLCEGAPGDELNIYAMLKLLNGSAADLALS